MNIRHTAANLHRVMLYTVPVSKKVNIAVIYSTFKNVKCTLVQALRFCTGRTAHRGSRGIAVLLGEGKVYPCTGTEALYRPYGP